MCKCLHPNCMQSLLLSLTLPHTPAGERQRERIRRWWGTQPLRHLQPLCSWLAVPSPQSPAQSPLWSVSLQIYWRKRQIVQHHQTKTGNKKNTIGIYSKRVHTHRNPKDITNGAIVLRILLKEREIINAFHLMNVQCPIWINLLVHCVWFHNVILSIFNLHVGFLHLCNVSNW